MSFKITVQDSSGNALEGASVAYTADGTTNTKTTDSSGLVEITGLAAGTYTFTGSMSGYADNSVELTSSDDTTEVDGTIALTAESTTTTEEESTVSTVEDAAKEAAVTAAISTAATTITSVVSSNSGLISKATTEISRLTAEIGTTESIWVKVRDAAEVTLLSGLLAGVTAGSVAAIKELEEKIK